MDQNKNIKDKVFSEPLKPDTEIPQKNPFKVPDNYFDELSTRIQERMNTQQKPAGTPIKTVIFNPRFLAAASFILILGLASIILYQLADSSQNTLDPIALEEFSTLSDYIMTNYEDMELMMAYMEMTDESENEYLFKTVDLQEEEVIEYLLQDDNLDYYLMDEY